MIMPPWVKIAEGELGTAEVPGDGDNPRIIEYHAVTTLKATKDLVPWCSAFACWCIENAGLKSPRSARALDWLKWGIPIERPVAGCIVILSRGNGNGHVGFYDHETDVSIGLLGGNQGDKVSVMKFSKERILGYRMPDGWAPTWHPPLKFQG